ncbi:DUF1499 domain-containing protein [bacterium]|nr:DUF1499 domain-containing protein [bacterium]
MKNSRLLAVGLIALLLIIVGVGVRLSIRAMSPLPSGLGTTYGWLARCPEGSNCVSSQAPDDAHKIAPILFTGADRRVAYNTLLQVMEDLPRATVVVSRVDYVHVEFRSAIWAFVDDVEFLLDETSGRIEVRGAARLCKDDGGRNRARLEEIRKLFTDKLAIVMKGTPQ